MPNASTKNFSFIATPRQVGLLLTVLVILIYMIGNPLLEVLELKTYDMRLQTGAKQPSSDAVAIVAIDEKSLAELGRWPWSRATMAKLVQRLDSLGAETIVFDVFFSEAQDPQWLVQLQRLENELGVNRQNSPYQILKRALGADSSFARAIGRSGKVILPMVFLMSPEEAGHQTPQAAEQSFDALRRQAIPIIKDSAAGRLDFPMAKPAGVIINLPALTQAARYVGHINSFADADGTLRWTPLVIKYKDQFFPSADVQAVRHYLKADNLILHTSAYGITALQIGARTLTTDEYGRSLIHYRGPEKTFPTYSVADVLNGELEQTSLRGKIVLVGATAKGLGDIRVTPYGAVFPGVEIRANVMDNLLSGDFIRRPGWMAIFDVALLLSLGIFLSLVLPRLGVRDATLTSMGLFLAYLALALWLFHSQLIWVTLVYPGLLMLILYVSSTIVKYLSAETEKRQIKRAFKHYVPAAVVDEIMHNIDNLGLGGVKRELTVLFSDIRGFTTLAETLAPEELVKLLNVYLTHMTEQVFKHDGLLDKYIGDAIMAVYGAPIARADHAKLACHTALDMMQALRKLQEEWQQQGLPSMQIGIGIHTGPMIVGNMGSKTRFDYTVIGDAVNLGSRIESLNKVYGTHVLISEFTYQQVKTDFPLAREIDVAQVRGRHEPVRLYELLGAEDYPHWDWLAEFARAYELFRAGLRPQARPVFKRLAEELNDPVSHYYVARCKERTRRTIM